MTDLLNTLRKTGASLDRAVLLLGQGRSELAEQEIRKAIAQMPEFAASHALLGLCLSERKQHLVAQKAAEKAIQLAPDEAYGYYALAQVLLEANQFRKAEQAIQQALRLNPEDAECLALLAMTYGRQNRWEKALVIAQQGLKSEPTNSTCLHCATLALLRLDRYRDAEQLARQALRLNPSNAETQVTLGWAQLLQGKTKSSQQAQQSFREALRLNPQTASAQEGLAEALKAQFVPYRLLSGSNGRFYLAAMLICIWSLAYFSFQLSGDLLLPVIVAVVGSLLIFMIEPIATLLLRFNPIGRLTLDPVQLWASNWFIAALLIMLASAGGYWVAKNTGLFFGALVSGHLMVRVSQVTQIASSRLKKFVQHLTTAYAITGFGGSICFIILEVVNPDSLPASLKMGLTAGAGIGIVVWMFLLLAYRFILNAEQSFTDIRSMWNHGAGVNQTMSLVGLAIASLLIWLLAFSAYPPRWALLISILTASGPYLVMGGIFNWNWLYEQEGAQWLIAKVGRSGMRCLNIGLGTVITLLCSSLALSGRAAFLR